MPSWIRHIETAVPGFSFSQEAASAWMQERMRDDRERRAVRVLHRKSGIDRRHSAITDFDSARDESFFKPGPDGLLRGPGTAARNDLYAREARLLSVDLARKGVAGCPGIRPEEITHVVVVSCTGFVNPGVDYFIVRELGLPDAVQRYSLGFMGCYAALPALRMADQFCAADRGAVVLVLSVELCTLHLQLLGTEDQMLANTLFADGAAAAIVTGREPEEGIPAYRLDGFRSALVAEGEADMAWRIGDDGFDIALSSYVPKLIGAHIRGVVEPALAGCGAAVAAVDKWAVHPGGKSIIDRVEEGLGLRPGQVAESREILRRYGNMSSASILFVLKEILGRAEGRVPRRVCAVAFGPGLTVELALLQAVGCASGVRRGHAVPAGAAS